MEKERKDRRNKGSKCRSLEEQGDGDSGESSLTTKSKSTQSPHLSGFSSILQSGNTLSQLVGIILIGHHFMMNAISSFRRTRTPLNSLKYVKSLTAFTSPQFHLISGLSGTETSNVIMMNILHWENPLHFIDRKVFIPSHPSEYDITFDFERPPPTSTHLVTSNSHSSSHFLNRMVQVVRKRRQSPEAWRDQQSARLLGRLVESEGAISITTSLLSRS